MALMPFCTLPCPGEWDLVFLGTLQKRSHNSGRGKTKKEHLTYVASSAFPHPDVQLLPNQEQSPAPLWVSEIPPSSDSIQSLLGALLPPHLDHTQVRPEQAIPAHSRCNQSGSPSVSCISAHHPGDPTPSGGRSFSPAVDLNTLFCPSGLQLVLPTTA